MNRKHFYYIDNKENCIVSYTRDENMIDFNCMKIYFCKGNYTVNKLNYDGSTQHTQTVDRLMDCSLFEECDFTIYDCLALIDFIKYFF